MAAENKGKGDDPRKRKRCYLPHNKPVKKRGTYPIMPGVKGFFITCDGGREHQASNEAINVIDSFFEELLNGKESSTKAGGTPEKPLNKKITFTYSDSDEEDDKQEDTKSTRSPGDGSNNGSNVEEISSHMDRVDKLPEIGSEEGVDGNEAADKEHPEVKTEEIEEPPVKKQCSVANKSESENPVLATTKEAEKEQPERKNEEIEEPLEKKQCSDVKKSESENSGSATTELSVDKLIEAELKELGDKSKRRFSKLDTGCNGVVFIQMRRRDGDPSTGDIVQHMMESAAKTKKHMSRFLLRVLPVEVSCYASDEEISRAIKPLVEQHFPADDEKPVKFAVQYDARANSGIERMKIIDAVAKSVPAPHKVDLKNPEKTIIAQVVKTVCMIGVVDKYKELSKFNLRELTS